ncbi:hypothetical protein, partial [Lacinutrix salivirga]
MAICLLYSINNYSQIQAEADCVDAIRLCDANISTYFVVDGSGAIDDANGSFTLACQNQTS